ncbi:MAG: CatB-related O-acetyltransferase [Syntrophorhabdaceae bacterium]
MKLSLLVMWAKLCKKIRGSSIINSQIHETSKIEAGSSVVNITMDKYSFCGYDCSMDSCDIGAFCSIGNNVKIGGRRHPMEWVSMSPVFSFVRDNSVKMKFSRHKKREHLRTCVGNDVWIGDNVLLKEGVKISDGAVIGMGSVVTRDVSPYTIVAGCPARIIRRRFDDKTISKLLTIKWWQFDEAKLRRYSKYMTSPDKFIRMVEEE